MMFQVNSIHTTIHFFAGQMPSILDDMSNQNSLGLLGQNLIILGLFVFVILLVAILLFLPLLMMFKDPVPWKIFLAAAPWWIAFAPVGLGLTVFGIWTFSKNPNLEKG